MDGKVGKDEFCAYKVQDVSSDGRFQTNTSYKASIKRTQELHKSFKHFSWARLFNFLNKICDAFYNTIFSIIDSCAWCDRKRNSTTYQEGRVANGKTDIGVVEAGTYCIKAAMDSTIANRQPRGHANT